MLFPRRRHGVSLQGIVLLTLRKKLRLWMYERVGPGCVRNVGKAIPRLRVIYLTQGAVITVMPASVYGYFLRSGSPVPNRLRRF